MDLTRCARACFALVNKHDKGRGLFDDDAIPPATLAFLARAEAQLAKGPTSRPGNDQQEQARVNEIPVASILTGGGDATDEANVEISRRSPVARRKLRAQASLLNSQSGIDQTTRRPVLDIPIHKINPAAIPNMRGSVAREKRQQLRESIRTFGQLHAIAVVEHKVGLHDYDLVEGFGRFELRGLASGSSLPVAGGVPQV